MFKKIKKHFNKILIACLTLISSIAIFSSINKTYAYTSDRISYSLKFYTDNTYTNEQTYNNYIDLDTGNSLYAQLNDSFISNSVYYIMYNYNVYTDNTYTTLADLNNNAYFLQYKTLLLNGNYTQVGVDRLKINQNNSNHTIINRLTNVNFDTSNYRDLTKWVINEFSSSYYIRIYNIDIIPYSDIGIQQYYDTYYSQIEDNYNQILEDYDTLQDNYQDLEDNYNTLEDNYNHLQEQYETTEQENLENQLYNQYGDLYNSSLQIDTTINGTTTSHVLSFNDMITNNIISNSYLYYNNAFNYLNIDTSIGFTTTTLNLAKPINTSNLNWVYNDENISGITFDLEYIDTNEETFQVGFTTEQASPIQLNTDFLLTKQIGNININNLYFDQFILNFNYATTNQVWISINTTNASIYNNGYNNGYKQAYNEQKETYQPIINNLRNSLTSVENQLNTLQTQYNDLVERYNRLDSNDNSLYAMVVSIADTPLRIFKQIFNFDVLGINIATITMSIISLLIIIWLIKKIF